jgi:hypothetical protein
MAPRQIIIIAVNDVAVVACIKNFYVFLSRGLVRRDGDGMAERSGLK